jgi:uncharacterized repeat protein (TIGR02543 family)
MRLKKRALSWLMTVVMLISLFPTTVKAGAAQLAIVTQPENVTWEVGETASFSVSATGENLTYQWQVKQVGKNDFSNSGSASAKTANYVFTMQNGHKGMQVRCVVTDASGASVTSETATCVEAPTLAIVSQPENVNWEVGKTASFAVSATGENLSYQWQVKQVGKNDFSNSGAASAKTANYMFTMQSGHKGMQVRCVVTDASGASVTSETATCVEAPTLAILSQPQNVTWKAGTTASFTVEAAGEGLTYQWQVKQVGKSDFSNSGAASAKTANYTFTMQNAHKGMQVRCVVTDASGASVTSETAMCVEAPALAIVSQPEDVTWEVGKTASFAVSATGENLTYQWQVKQVGKNDFSNSGAASAKTANYMFTMQSGHKGMQVRCVVTDANGASVTSEIATCVERQVLAIVSQPENVMWKAGTTASFEVEAVGEGLTYQWQVKQVGKNDFSNSGSASAKTANYTFTMQNGHKGMQVRCVVTDASGASVTSEAATCVEPPSLAIVSQPVDQMWAVGQVASFEIVAIGEELTYQWQVKMSGREDFVNSSANAAKTANYRFTMQNAHKGMEVRCVVTDKNGESVTSDVAIVSENPIYTVTYDAGRGMFPTTKQKTYVVMAEPGPYYLDDYGEDMVPVLDGYEFHGWLYEGKFVEQVNLTSNIVLTPMWVQVFDLVFDANGGHFPDATTQAVTTKTVKVGHGTHRLDNVMDEPIPDPIRNGYIFVGWLYNNKIVKKVKITDASVTVVAQWETAYKVTYDADGGLMSWWDEQQDDQVQGTQYVKDVPAGPYYVYDAPRPWRTDATTNEYYEFECWTQTVNGKDVRVDDCINLTANLTLKAQYSKLVHITYDANGGEFDDGSTTKEDDAHSGPFTSYWVTDGNGRNVSCDNCSFLGWSTQANATTGDNNFDAFLTEDTTYYAVWSEKPVITYDANGGYFYHKDVYDQNGQQVFDDHGNPMKEAVTIERRGMELGEGKVDGFGVNFDGPYQFIGWSTDAKATTATYQPGDPITITGSIWLYAVFKQMPTIIYDANGGGWGHYEPIPSATEDGDVTEQFVIDETEKMHWDNAGFYYYVGCEMPERPGYEFRGWYTAADATGVNADDDELLLEEGTIYHYYAHWAKWVTMTYVTNEPNTGWGRWDRDTDENGVETIVFEQTSFTRDAVAGKDCWIDGWRPNAADSPAKFLGYSTDPQGTEVEYEVDDPIELTDDITLYAVWGEHPTIHYVCLEKDAGWGYWEDTDNDGEDEFIFETQERIDWRNIGDHEYYVYYVGCERPERPGYEFDHWVDDQGVVVDDTALELREGESYTFHATWIKRLTVTYVTNLEGSGWGETVPNEDEEVGGEVYECTSIQDEDLWPGTYYINGWWPECELASFPYQFVGYTTVKGGTEAMYQPGDPYTLTDDITFYAVWQKMATVTYNAGDGGWDGFWADFGTDEGTLIPCYTAKKQVDAIEPGRVYYVGWEGPELLDENYEYEFAGWVDTEGHPADDMELTNPISGMNYNFYATWRKKVTVTYTTDIGGWGWFDNDAPEGEKYEYTSFTNEDRGWGDVWTGEYHVDGWNPNCCDGPYEFAGYTTEEGGTVATLQPGQKITLTDDTTFFAIWKQLPTITYDGNGGGWGEYDEDEDTYEESTKLDWRTPGHYYHVRYWQPYRENYDFGGWVDEQGVPKDDVALLLADGDEYTFKAKWIPHVTIVYYANGGEFDGWEPNEGESSIRHIRHERGGEYWLDGWHPNREGYDFGGWSLTPENQQKVTEPYNLTQDTMFYAIWDELLTVTYDGNGGVWYDWAEDPTTGEYQTVTLTQQQQTDVHRGRYDVGYGEWPEREGYAFRGWASTRDSQQASEWWTTEINGNTTFYAIWEKLMVVTYDAGDGYFWYDEQDKEYVTNYTHYARRNEIIRINDWVEGSKPEREGYRFDGWLYNGDALRWVRASQDLTFTADWVKTYEVQLVANGGYFNSFDEWNYEGSFDTWQDGEEYVFYKQQCDDGEGYDFFNGGFPVPQRDGYTFIGWSYPSDNDENLVYARNVVINGADMELFAQWEPIPDYEPEMISANDYQ